MQDMLNRGGRLTVFSVKEYLLLSEFNCQRKKRYSFIGPVNLKMYKVSLKLWFRVWGKSPRWVKCSKHEPDSQLPTILSMISAVSSPFKTEDGLFVGHHVGSPLTVTVHDPRVLIMPLTLSTVLMLWRSTELQMKHCSSLPVAPRSS